LDYFLIVLPFFPLPHSESLYEYSYTMPSFLTNGTTAECQKVFKEYLCALVFPACDGLVQSCVGTCNNFKSSVWFFPLPSPSFSFLPDDLGTKAEAKKHLKNI
jgi:hypothetical protein